MITREMLKTEIDKVNSSYYEALYKIIKVFENPVQADDINNKFNKAEWHKFIQETYGSLSDAPIVREQSSEFEKREEML